MSEIQVVTNRPRFMNKDLEKATVYILNCESQVRARQFDIAAVLAEVDAKKLYKDDGFASAAEYANATFGMQKTLAYALIEVGTNYTRPLYSDKGRVIGHCSNLLPPADVDKQTAPLVDFTTGQIARMASLGREKVVNLVKSGEVNPRMTHREIDAVVKAHKPPKALKEAAQPAEPEQPTEPAEQPSQPAEQPSQPAEQPSRPAERSDGETVFPRYPEVSRDESWDKMPTDILIAEIRARGFSVLDRDGNAVLIDWKTE